MVIVVFQAGLRAVAAAMSGNPHHFQNGRFYAAHPGRNPDRRVLGDSSSINISMALILSKSRPGCTSMPKLQLKHASLPSRKPSG
jgi:hypothetical protein